MLARIASFSGSSQRGRTPEGILVFIFALKIFATASRTSLCGMSSPSRRDGSLVVPDRMRPLLEQRDAVTKEEHQEGWRRDLPVTEKLETRHSGA